jgi:signal transduction histidine kinase
MMHHSDGAPPVMTEEAYPAPRLCCVGRALTRQASWCAGYLAITKTSTRHEVRTRAVQRGPQADEIKRLQGCITDLLSVLALPAIWSSHESSQIADTLLDVLLRLLRLDFAYVRRSDELDGTPIELVRVAQPYRPAPQPRAVDHALSRWVIHEPCPVPVVITNPVGPGEVSIARFRLGLEDAVGVVVAGAQRADFPTQVERLLGGVAANQAAIGLQEARRMRDQQRAAAELEQRVVERTTQLTAINEAMQLLTTRLLQLQDEERRRIARHLHHVTAQDPGAIAVNLAHLRRLVTDLTPEAQTLVTESVALAEDVLQHIRTLSYLLHAPLLDQLGLAAALQWYISGFTKRSGIHVDLAIAPEIERLSPDIDTALFRIVQESLTNIHRHSGSASARITLVKKGQRVRLHVKDQGAGILDEASGEALDSVQMLGLGILDSTVPHLLDSSRHVRSLSS